MVVVEGDNVEALGALRPLSALTLIRGLARSTEMPAELLISIAFEYALERGGVPAEFLIASSLKYASDLGQRHEKPELANGFPMPGATIKA